MLSDLARFKLEFSTSYSTGEASNEGNFVTNGTESLSLQFHISRRASAIVCL
jgi:hypothetical protein